MVSWKKSGRWVAAGKTSKRDYTITGLAQGAYAIKVTAKTSEGAAVVSKNHVVLTK